MKTLEKFDLRGRCIIVTGAGRGLGKAMAFALSDAGCNVVVADIDANGAEQTACEISSAGPRCVGLKADVTSEEDAERVVKTAVAEFGAIHGLVNNAGIAVHGPLLDYRLEDWQRQLAVNVTSLFVMSRAVGRELVSRKSGVVVNIASMSGVICNNPQPQVPYNTSKGAVVMFTRSLASEWVSLGIRVNAIAPGYMRTDQTAAIDERGELMRRWMLFTPMARMGKPEELGGLVVYLASDASSYVTGQVILIDGGYTIW
ncbi:MAG TPA: glucose 1-dehydrogenase [Spirochaetia bacterium]|nr:glucose 1-dehydrogenase [Spirochaetia bacterium]